MTARRPCIFDLDGLLLDTESIYTLVTNAILARFGKALDPVLKGRMMGQKKLESARILVETLGVPLAPEDYLSERAPLLMERFPECAALPGAEALVRRLAAAGVPLALATGSDEVEFEAKTRAHRAWIELFATRVLGDDPAVKRGKPAPDIFLEAARRLGAVPSECLAFEDAPNGAQAALAAGMTVIAVPGPHAPRSVYPTVHELLDSLAEFRPERYGLVAA
ncbi:MAG: HAD-IA family hydrolase [Deltaproteobacteria bacterium]|jgi:pseudouridine-5'-monophosphatase|nr:HAD-IA family hydrolase [Deltaproteobacteria bacterium]